MVGKEVKRAVEGEGGRKGIMDSCSEQCHGLHPAFGTQSTDHRTLNPQNPAEPITLIGDSLTRYQVTCSSEEDEMPLWEDEAKQTRR